MVKYIVGGVVIVLTWALALLVPGFPNWIATMITLVVVLVLLLLVGIDKLKERRAARDLERALSAQAAEQAASARPDIAQDIAEMQAEFQKAVAALKTSKKGGKKALYALPWYAIIGPPGCGKSTALRNSGLQFPYLSASGGGVRGLGGTRNCDWWMTSEAVILDTAGRWTSEDEDHDEWLGFLDLLKRFRSKKPLNGIIAAISVGDVGGAREDEVISLAKRIRERIDEVQGRLSLSLPVYVLFTKCDLIPGFVETFGDMSKEDRSQVWGFTAPLKKRIGTPAEYFQKGYDELLAVLSQRALKRMGEERKIANRELIYALPQQLAVLNRNLQEFVHQLFQENVFKETPLLRGVYFTSGTQEGRPIDRVMSAMAEAFGQPQVQLPAPQVESKSYFLRDMFAHVVFRDADVAARSPEELKRQRNRIWVAAATILLFALGFTVLPTVSFMSNRSYLVSTRSTIDDSGELLTEENRRPVEANEIEALRVRAAELDEWMAAGPPVYMQMGMYQDEVANPVNETYLAAMKRRVIGPLLASDVNEMNAFASAAAANQGSGRVPEATQVRTMYQAMKLHLLLTTPRGENEPPLDEDLLEFVRTELIRKWRTATHTPRHDPQYPMIQENIEQFVAALASHPDLLLDREEQAIAGVRQVFAAVGGPRMAVQGIIAELAEDNCDIRFEQLVINVGQVRGGRLVRCAFTRSAWDRRVQGILDEGANEFFGDAWVLGEEPPETEHQADLQREERVAELKSFFLEQYVQEWVNFIDGIEVVRATNDQEQMRLLTVYTNGDPQFITQLIRQVDYNVTLAPPPGSEDDGPANESMADRAARLAQRRIALAADRELHIGNDNAENLLGAGAEAATANAEFNPRVPPPGAMTPARVRLRFHGFLSFSPSQADLEGVNVSRTMPPARRYEEKLEYLREGLRNRIGNVNQNTFTERQTDAQTLTARLIDEVAEQWRPRFTSLLMPPILGPAYIVPGSEPTPPPVAPAPAEATPPANRPRRRTGWW